MSLAKYKASTIGNKRKGNLQQPIQRETGLNFTSSLSTRRNVLFHVWRHSKRNHCNELSEAEPILTAEIYRDPLTRLNDIILGKYIFGKEEGRLFLCMCFTQI